MRRILLSFTAIALMTGCKVGPNYKRPDVAAPPQYRAAAPQAQPPAQTFGDLKWFEVFQDAKLQELIKEALQKNYDVRIAAQRVLAARELITIAKAPLFPQVSGEARIDRQGGLRVNANTAFAGANASWELDIWGRIRRETEAARADYLAREDVRNGVIQTLVADVASGYFRLLQLDAAIGVTERSIASRQTSVKLVEARLTGGVSNKMELNQSVSLVESAEVTLVELQRAREQQENALSVLLGRNPGPIERGIPLDAQRVTEVDVPSGLPSSLLERRPDIRQAEQALIAANARVGAAKALMFPSISLTGSGGYRSNEITNIFKASGGVYGYGAGLTAPLFNAGQLWANYKASQAEREAAALGYQQSILNALRDVSDSLIGRQKARELVANQRELVATLREMVNLSNLRYRGGVTSYLEVLDTERQALDAELAFTDAYLAELDWVVALYKSLGGGWQI